MTVPEATEDREGQSPAPKVTALAGGIGAAKFLTGLVRVLAPEQVTVIANTGDDIELHGLRICPDVDTVTYTLAGVANQETGWGVAGDSFNCLGWIEQYGVENWFNLGDRDMATHIFRTEQLRLGRSLTGVTDHVRRSLGVGSRILPMSDDYTPTQVLTSEGKMHLQEYFVRRRCEPQVESIEFQNIESSQPGPGIEAAILEADAVIVCPSNPFISIGPILAVPGIRDLLIRTRAPVVAITPIVAGKALKGPAAQMLRDLGHEVSAAGVARMYRDFADLFVLDRADAESVAGAGTVSAIEQLGLKARSGWQRKCCGQCCSFHSGPAKSIVSGRRYDAVSIDNVATSESCQPHLFGGRYDAVSIENVATSEHGRPRRAAPSAPESMLGQGGESPPQVNALRPETE
jgi:LPPG:FO 2-phospho-L-lactate transferase